MRRFLSIALLCATAVACKGKEVSEIVVVVYAEQAVAEQIDELEFLITHGDDTQRKEVAVTTDSFPVTLGVAHEGGSLEGLTIAVRGQSGGSTRIVWQAFTSFVENRSKRLVVSLTEDCVDESCGELEVCRAADCYDATVDSSQLEDFTGDIFIPDAGHVDAWNCDDNHLDCNQSASDGCETDIRTSLEHCGGCDAPCELDHASESCEAGACVLVSCDSNFDDCDNMDSTGCEDDLSSVSACGRCFNVCEESCLAGYCDGNEIVELAAGASHSCALRENGEVICWGSNSNGRLGNGTTVLSSIPVPAQLSGDADQVSLGDGHSCARVGVDVFCWGANAFGQLGDDTTVDRSRPTEVVRLGEARFIATGTGHSCAVLSGGTTQCWGRNDQGQLGDGTRIQSLDPTFVEGIDAVQVVAGANHTCALLTDQTIACWGKNDRGQLGIGNIVVTQSSSPVPIDSDAQFSAIASGAGANHTCAIDLSDQAWCWGQGNKGQLGNGSTMDSATPTMAFVGAASVSVGAVHSCAIDSSGALRCWGENTSGQLGNGTTVASVDPVSPSGLPAVEQGALGNGHSCVRAISGAVYCWGLNIVGQVGDATTQTRTSPVGVRGLPNP